MSSVLGLPVDILWIVGGIMILVVALLSAWFSVRQGSSRSQSRAAHEAAQSRDAPVEIGGTYTLGVTEITPHHTGQSQAVGKVEGFVLFIEDIPSDLEEGDVIRAKVMSFNEGGTSATAKFIDWT